jgi:hypothetical protein
LFWKGTLAKQTQWSRQWKKEYYVLSDKNLYLFKSDNNLVPVRNRPIELEGYEVAYGDGSSKSNSRVFKLTPRREDDDRRVWELRADTEDQVHIPSFNYEYLPTLISFSSPRSAFDASLLILTHVFCSPVTNLKYVAQCKVWVSVLLKALQDDKAPGVLRSYDGVLRSWSRDIQ